MTTTAKLGFKVIGYVIKSRQKEVEEKFYKFPYKTEEEVPGVLARIFKFPKCQNDNGDKEDIEGLGTAGEMNHEAIGIILKELERLQDFLENRSQRDIKGASILIIVDHFARDYCIKMIDLSTIKVY